MKIISIDATGTIKEKEYTRSAFAALFDDLNIRDLRPVFSPFQVATIIPREGATVLNMGFIKCVLTPETTYFIIHRHEDRIRNIITHIAKIYKKPAQTSHIIMIMEIIFDEKLYQIKEKTTHIDHQAQMTLERIRKNFSEQDLEKLLAIKKRLSKVATRTKEILSAAEEVLEDQEYFNYILLLTHTPQKNHDELQSVFENFIEQLEDIVGQTFRMEENIQDTEEFVHLKLNARRTTIIRIDLLATLFTVILSFLAVIVGLYGTNIRNGLEESPIAFSILSLVLLLITSVGSIIIVKYLKKINLF